MGKTIIFAYNHKHAQMIGRGTRLCESIYGDGKNKNGFLIFDYCGSFEYFGQHPEGKDGKETPTLSQRLFQVKLDVLYELQRVEYQEDDWFHAYYARIKEELQNTVIQIKSHSNRIQVREAMQYVDKYYDKTTWETLSPVMVREAKVHLSSLLDSGLGDDHLAIAFDIRMYYIEKVLLQTGTINGASEHIKNVRMIAQFLLSEKASVPQVLAKAFALKEIINDAFWDDPSVLEIEKKEKCTQRFNAIFERFRKKKI